MRIGVNSQFQTLSEKQFIDRHISVDQQREQKLKSTREWIMRSGIRWLNFCTMIIFLTYNSFKTWEDVLLISCVKSKTLSGIYTPALLRSDSFLKPSFWAFWLNTQWAPRKFFPSGIIIFDFQHSSIIIYWCLYCGNTIIKEWENKITHVRVPRVNITFFRYFVTIN